MAGSRHAAELVLYRHGWVSAVQSFPEIPKFLFGLESHLLSSIASERSASDRGSEYQKIYEIYYDVLEGLTAATAAWLPRY